jgi:hypothetical protein
MREIRLSGSEGGGTGTTRSFLPLSGAKLTHFLMLLCYAQAKTGQERL